VGGKHYGISLQWGPNTLLYNTKKVKPAPTSWSVIYSPKYKGKVTVPDNPIQIADAALYLMKHQPSLGIKDPYELNPTQFAATVALLKSQKPLIKKYWALRLTRSTCSRTATRSWERRGRTRRTP
jgi:Spermidine/putrescine-binding periplasmic protein